MTAKWPQKTHGSFYSKITSSSWSSTKMGRNAIENCSFCSEKTWEKWKRKLKRKVQSRVPKTWSFCRKLKIARTFSPNIFSILADLSSGNIHRAFLWNSAYARPTYLIFGRIKDADNIYYCTKNQVRGFCVGGDIVML